ncbi:MAG: response regulator [Candidatus Binatia bacterium]
MTFPATFGGPTLLGGVRVLLVDDHRPTLRVLAAVLERSGARATIAESAAQADEILGRDGADVLVCDVTMPGEDGYQFIRRLRGRESGGRLPALALTAHAGAQDRDLAIVAGFDRHLPKPVDPAVLVAAIADMLGRSGGGTREAGPSGTPEPAATDG